MHNQKLQITLTWHPRSVADGQTDGAVPNTGPDTVKKRKHKGNALPESVISSDDGEELYSNKKETSDFHGTVCFDPGKMSQQK